MVWLLGLLSSCAIKSPESLGGIFTVLIARRRCKLGKNIITILTDKEDRLPAGALPCLLLAHIPLTLLYHGLCVARSLHIPAIQAVNNTGPGSSRFPWILFIHWGDVEGGGRLFVGVPCPKVRLVGNIMDAEFVVPGSFDLVDGMLPFRIVCSIYTGLKLVLLATETKQSLAGEIDFSHEAI